MKVQKVKLSSYEYSWIVLDDNHLPIKPITEFIRYLNNVDKSPCTVRSYANHLKLFWEFLEEKKIQWLTINLASLAGFVGWLRNIKNDDPVIELHEDRSQRKSSTINVMLGCISSFYRFHNQLGNTDVTITEPWNLPGNRYKSLLHHVFKNKPVQRRLISVRQTRELPKIITEDQFNQINNACTNYRDRFLLLLLHETGLRIGQALALRHEDIICWDNEIHVKYRCGNLNEVRNKTARPNVLHVSNTVMELYGEYINSLEQNRLNEYVFINFHSYEPLRYSAVKKMFTILEKKCDFHIRPHMLRHTHASSLINAGWDMSLVQQRLGHASIQTTINTYTHIDNKAMKQAFKRYISTQENSQ